VPSSERGVRALSCFESARPVRAWHNRAGDRPMRVNRRLTFGRARQKARHKSGDIVEQLRAEALRAAQPQRQPPVALDDDDWRAPRERVRNPVPVAPLKW
jgi:hypothetical protein